MYSRIVARFSSKRNERSRPVAGRNPNSSRSTNPSARRHDTPSSTSAAAASETSVSNPQPISSRPLRLPASTACRSRLLPANAGRNLGLGRECRVARLALVRDRAGAQPVFDRETRPLGPGPVRLPLLARRDDRDAVHHPEAQGPGDEARRGAGVAEAGHDREGSRRGLRREHAAVERRHDQPVSALHPHRARRRQGDPRRRVLAQLARDVRIEALGNRGAPTHLGDVGGRQRADDGAALGDERDEGRERQHVDDHDPVAACRRLLEPGPAPLDVHLARRPGHDRARHDHGPVSIGPRSHSSRPSSRGRIRTPRPRRRSKRVRSDRATRRCPADVRQPNPGPGRLPGRGETKGLTAAPNYWISTTRLDSRPHARPVWGVWLDGAFYFSTGSLAASTCRSARDHGAPRERE